MLDPDNACRYPRIRGTVVHVSETGGAAHVDRRLRKLIDPDDVPWASKP